MVRDFSHVNSTEQLRSGKKFSSILFIFALSIFHVPRLFKQLTTKKRGKNMMFCKRWKHCWCWCCPTLACSSRVGDGRIMSCIVHYNNNVFCGNFSTKSAGLLFFLSFQLHKNLLKNVWKHSTPNKAKQEKNSRVHIHKNKLLNSQGWSSHEYSSAAFHQERRNAEKPFNTSRAFVTPTAGTSIEIYKRLNW